MAKRKKRTSKKMVKVINSEGRGTEGMFHQAATLHEQGALDQAENLCQKILSDAPKHAWALNLLGVIQCQTNRGENGIKLIASALQYAPEEVSFYNNFGTGLTGLGRQNDAIIAFKRALELQPDYSAAHNNIAAPFKALGKLSDAEKHYREAIRLRPDFGEAWANLANVLLDIGKIDEAEKVARKAVELSPDYSTAHNNLGVTLHRRGLYSEAEACFRHAIELHNGYADALCNLGEVLKEQGRTTEAMKYYDEAWRLAPDEPDKGGNRLFAMCCLASMTPKNISDAHREWGKPFLLTPKEDFAHRCKNSSRRLRIGYVSADFRRHSVAYFLEPIFENHDKSAFEIFSYANMTGSDELTNRFKGLSDHWRDVFGLDDQAMAAQVLADKIDILVDLSGHTRGGRLTVFASRPAPVQITYLGYPASTGLEQIDYRISDPWSDPPTLTENLHTEKLLRLNDGFLCYRPPEDAPDVGPLPLLESGHVTFGSFNNLAKLTPRMIKCWAKILRSVRGSQLRLKAKALGDQMTRTRIFGAFAKQGIEEKRLELMPWITDSSPLAAYQGVDIALDTYPYHGTTTTMEALWMGVPVVTLAGNWHASRVGISILARANLDELIATTPSDYIKIATTLASSPNAIKNYRHRLRASVVAGGLTNGPRFTKKLEKVYRQAWKNWVISA